MDPNHISELKALYVFDTSADIFLIFDLFGSVASFGCKGARRVQQLLYIHLIRIACATGHAFPTSTVSAADFAPYIEIRSTGLITRLIQLDFLNNDVIGTTLGAAVSKNIITSLNLVNISGVSRTELCSESTTSNIQPFSFVLRHCQIKNQKCMGEFSAVLWKIMENLILGSVIKIFAKRCMENYVWW